MDVVRQAQGRKDRQAISAVWAGLSDSSCPRCPSCPSLWLGQVLDCVSGSGVQLGMGMGMGKGYGMVAKIGMATGRRVRVRRIVDDLTWIDRACLYDL